MARTARTARPSRFHPDQTNPNRVHLSTGKTVNRFNDEWANYAEVQAAYSGAFDAERIRAALSSSPRVVGVAHEGSVFSVTRVDGRTLRYVVRYWIGD